MDMSRRETVQEQFLQERTCKCLDDVSWSALQDVIWTKRHQTLRKDVNGRMIWSKVTVSRGFTLSIHERIDRNRVTISKEMGTGVRTTLTVPQSPVMGSEMFVVQLPRGAVINVVRENAGSHCVATIDDLELIGKRTLRPAKVHGYCSVVVRDDRSVVVRGA